MTVAAGENWDDVVAHCVGRELAAGMLVRDSAGRRHPIQNVVLRQEVADTITSVRAMT